MNEVMMYPANPQRENPIGTAVLYCARITWGLGAIIGIYAGNKLGDVYEYFGGRSFDWGVAFSFWIAAFLSGLMLRAIAEIIFLLHESNTLTYKSDGIKELAKELKTGQASANIEKKTEEKLTFILTGNEQDIPFTPKHLYITWEEYDVTRLVYSVSWTGAISVKGILADVEIKTLFGKTIVQKDLEFVNFARHGRDELESEPCLCKIPKVIANTIVSVKVTVKGYIFDDEHHVPGDGFTNEKPKEKPVVSIEKETPKAQENSDKIAVDSKAMEAKGTEIVFCTNCGAKITDPESIFCHACGAKVER